MSTCFKEMTVQVTLPADALSPLQFLLQREIERIRRDSGSDIANYPTPGSWADVIRRLEAVITTAHDANLT